MWLDPKFFLKEGDLCREIRDDLPDGIGIFSGKSVKFLSVHSWLGVYCKIGTQARPEQLQDDALSFVSIRTSPILCDAHSTLCFGEFCLEVIPRENAKYNFSFGTVEQFETYKLKSTLFPQKKNVSLDFQDYPTVKKRDVFIIKRLIISNYGYLYDVEEHLSINGQLLMEKRTLLNTINTVGRDVYMSKLH